LDEDRLRAGQIPLCAQQDVDHLTVLIDGTIEISPLAADPDRRFIDIPALPDASQVAACRGSEMRAEAKRPGQAGPLRDVDAALGEPIAPIGAREADGALPADGHEHASRRPAIAGEPGAGADSDGASAPATAITLVSDRGATVLDSQQALAAGAGRQRGPFMTAADDHSLSAYHSSASRSGCAASAGR
jgi:hypothetical protein